MPDPISRLNAALEGRYRIERQLGEGGMATVYLADDLRHERKVALKVLKAELAAVVGADRFLAEIKTTANLHHPHILPLFDSGEADGFLFYVMPFVEGESLRQRIDREKQLPVADAVAITTAVASALQHAHERGVVHRDIKPANILMQGGQPVVADFGIALAVGAAGGNRLTETGLSVGTPYYMSPEQATGDQQVGPASDIYALACVLHEMLTGDPPYLGSTAQAVLGQIIAGDPVSVKKKRRSVPANVDAAIRRALEKLPADRFTGAEEFTRALADPVFEYGQSTRVSSAGGRPWNALTVALAVTTLLFGGIAGALLLRPAPPRPVERFPSPFLAGQEPVPTVGGWGLSADGSTMAYARPGALWVRRLHELEATPVPGTNPTGRVSLSPDGDRVVYSEGPDVRILSLSRGSPRTLLTSAAFPIWGSDNHIYATMGGRVVRMRPEGGPPEPLTQPVEGQRGQIVTDILPGGRAALLIVNRINMLPPEIHALDLTTLETTMVVQGRYARYAQSGHIVFADSGTGDYMAAPFDADALQITGPAVTVMEGPLGGFELSPSGTLVYTYRPDQREFAWVTRSGQPESLGWTYAGQGSRGFSLSRDDRLLAFTSDGLDPGSGGNIWTKELPNGPTTIVADEEGVAWDPRWRSDGESLIYTQGLNFTRSVLSRRADGTGAAEVLFEPDSLDVPSALLSPDEEWLILRTGGGALNIMAMRLGIDSLPHPLLGDAYDATQPDISPDGRWLAYASNESGQLEVYVRPFPDTEGGRTVVSTNGGRQPRWAHNGAELFYVSGEAEMWSARYETTPGFRVTARDRLFEIPEGFTGLGTPPFYTAYEVSSDDQRFLMTRPSTSEDAQRLPGVVVVQNFDEELKELVPVR
jgi:hypothetical protein